MCPIFDIVPSHILLSNTDVKLTTAIDHREARLKTQLDAIQAQYDYVFIDCPPALSWLTINAFTASDKVLVTVSPGYFELDSIVQISKTINEVQEYFNPAIQIAGFLIYDGRPDDQLDHLLEDSTPNLYGRGPKYDYPPQHRYSGCPL